MYLVDKLPWFNRTRLNGKHRMRVRSLDLSPAAVVRRAPRFQLARQVAPLKLELSLGADDVCLGADFADFSLIKRVPARLSLRQDRCKIGIDGGARSGVNLESMELRVVTIPRCFATEYGARKERLAP